MFHASRFISTVDVSYQNATRTATEPSVADALVRLSLAIAAVSSE